MSNLLSQEGPIFGSGQWQFPLAQTEFPTHSSLVLQEVVVLHVFKFLSYSDPLLHLHEYEPFLFRQTPSLPQISLFPAHSSMSEKHINVKINYETSIIET